MRKGLRRRVAVALFTARHPECRKTNGIVLSSTHHPDSQFLHIRDGVQLGARGHDVGVLGEQVCLDDAAPVVGRLEMRVLRMDGRVQEC